MPITPEGNFLAYKGVQSDYYSITSGTIDIVKGQVMDGHILNAIGEEIEVVRNQVCDDKDLGCSKGLHAGSMKYATDFASNGKVVIVEINPADVVSIPTDCSCQKLRTCAYKVVAEFEVPLNDNYCDKYSEEKITDTNLDCDEDCDECEEDCDKCEEDEIVEEIDPQVVLDDAWSEGFDSGYDDGLNNLGFDNTFDNETDAEVIVDGEDNAVAVAEYIEAWQDGYQSGYDEGVSDRFPTEE